MCLVMYLVQIQKKGCTPTNVFAESIEDLTKCLSDLDSDSVALVSKVVKYE